MVGLQQPHHFHPGLRTMAIQIFSEQMPFLTGPFSWEVITQRLEHKYRIRDAKDDPAGWADTSHEADDAVRSLNAT